MGAAVGVFAFILAIIQLAITVYMLFLATKFVQAAERMADAHEKFARSYSVAHKAERE